VRRDCGMCQRGGGRLESRRGTGIVNARSDQQKSTQAHTTHTKGGARTCGHATMRCRAAVNRRHRVHDTHIALFTCAERGETAARKGRQRRLDVSIVEAS